MSVFIFLHIAVMFLAIAVAQGPLILLIAAVRRRDVPGIRGLLRAQFPLVRWIPAVFGVGVLLGLIAVFTNSFDPLRPWLLIGYVLTVIAAVLPRFSAGAWSRRLGMRRRPARTMLLRRSWRWSWTIRERARCSGSTSASSCSSSLTW